MEKKYLESALTDCIKCYDKNPYEDCSEKCSKKYLEFMCLKEFYIKKNNPTEKDLIKLENILDAL